MHGIQTNPEEAAPRRKNNVDLVSVGGNGSLVDHNYRNYLRVTGFGRIYYGHEVDWSLRPFQKIGDGDQNLPSANLLPLVAESLGISEILAPRPVFGRNVCRRLDLRTTIRFERDGKKVVLLRGCDADITVLNQGETYGISAGGCPIGWMYHPSKRQVVVAHMGLECLIDKEAIFRDGKRQLKSHRSVVDRMIRLLNLPADQESEIRAGYEFPIDPLHYPHHWDHPTDSIQNKILCEYIRKEFGERCIVGWHDERERQLGRIELGLIIRSQYLSAKIRPENIHSSSAPRTLDEKGQPVWYDTRGPFGKDARNLILISAL